MMEDQIELPPGFRFHPTDEELITHYLLNKVVDHTFDAKAIGVVDMNKIEPWELPKEAKISEKEWYFFCFLDKKYPTGLRTNRATAAGYWKATGKDKQIFRGRSLVGMKKTLVFYMGRAPKGEKTNWVIHEYRLEGEFSHNKLPKSAKIEWVICRVFHKNSGEKKLQISGLIMADSGGGGDGGGGGDALPPLINSPATYGGTIINSSVFESNHVHCFSNSIENQTTHKNMITNLLNNPISPFEFNPNSSLKAQSNPITHQFPSGGSLSVSNSAILRGLIGPNGNELKETEMVAGSQETGVSSEKNTSISCEFEEGNRGFEIVDHEAPSASIGTVDLDCLWNY